MLDYRFGSLGGDPLCSQRAAARSQWVLMQRMQWVLCTRSEGTPRRPARSTSGPNYQLQGFSDADNRSTYDSSRSLRVGGSRGRRAAFHRWRRPRPVQSDTGGGGGREVAALRQARAAGRYRRPAYQPAVHGRPAYQPALHGYPLPYGPSDLWRLKLVAGLVPDPARDREESAGLRLRPGQLWIQRLDAQATNLVRHSERPARSAQGRRCTG